MYNGEKIKRSIIDAAKEILEKGPKFRHPNDPLRTLTRTLYEEKPKKEELNEGARRTTKEQRRIKNESIDEGKTLKTVGKIAKHIGRNVGLYGGAAYAATTGDWERGITVGGAAHALHLAVRQSGKHSGEDRYHDSPALQKKGTYHQPPEEFMPDTIDQQYQNIKNRIKSGISKLMRRKRKI